MFKSCDYCRHRKKKCVPSTALATRCDDCEYRNIECTFTYRKPSLKRQKTSQLIASRISTSVSPKSRHLAATATRAGIEDGDRLTQRQPDSSGVAAKVMLMYDGIDDGEDLLSTADKYNKHVRLLTPFVPEEMLAGDEMHEDIVRYCVQLASNLSIRAKRALPAADQVNNDLMMMVGSGEMSLGAAAGILLLVLRLDLDESIIDRV